VGEYKINLLMNKMFLDKKYGIYLIYFLTESERMVKASLFEFKKREKFDEKGK
jgi:hypothetical protein